MDNVDDSLSSVLKGFLLLLSGWISTNVDIALLDDDGSSIDFVDNVVNVFEVVPIREHFIARELVGVELPKRIRDNVS